MPPNSTTGLTIGTLPRMTAKQLRSLLLSPSSASKIAIIDVRDSDYLGGHIRSSTHSPSSSLDTAMPELVRTLRDKDTVVFHCMLSQQRGPGAALGYARERARLLKNVPGSGAAVEGPAPPLHQENADGEGAEGVQMVAVLVDGFQGWVNAGYGEDERLTEGFQRDLFESLT